MAISPPKTKSNASPDYGSMGNFFDSCTDLYSERIAYSIHDGKQWQELTYSSLKVKAHEFADYLRHLGVTKGEPVAILSEANLLWPVAFFGILLSGATVVPIDPKLTVAEAEAILTHVKAKYLFCSQSLFPLGRQVKQTVTSLQKLLSLTSWEEGKLPTIYEYLYAGESRVVQPAETAIISYTSGSLGVAKGVRLSPQTLLFETQRVVDFTEGDYPEVVFSILPLNHLFGLTCGLMGTMAVGGELCFPHTLSPKAIEKYMSERKAACMLAVPQLLTLIKNGVDRKIAEKSSHVKWVFNQLLLLSQIPFLKFLKRYLFGEMHRKFGGSLRRIVCGGAPLSPELFRFYDRVGIPVCEGYGLTETGPIISFNSARIRRRGSVGKPLEGVEVKIETTEPQASEGEILTRGPHLMQGYLNAPELNQEVFSKDGWFRTGDIGYLDKDGFLFITGRVKNLIALPNGKKVHPEEVEVLLAKSQLIQEACVMGLRKNIQDPTAGEQVTAIIIPSQNLFDSTKGDTKKIKSHLLAEFESLLSGLAAFKHPTQILIRTEPFVKTSSLKIKRKVLRDELEKDYGAVATTVNKG